MIYIYNAFTEDGSAMDTDSKQPQTTPISHQCVLRTVNAVCTQESVIQEVIPQLVEHVQHLCEGKRYVVFDFLLSSLFHSWSEEQLYVSISCVRALYLT